MSNRGLRAFLRELPHSEHLVATNAVEACLAAGLKLDPETYEVFLALLLDAGQLRQALEVYQSILAAKVLPHTRTYNRLIQLCQEKQTEDSAITIFEDMQRRGRQPDLETYELMMVVLASQKPSQWQRAVTIFDRLQRIKRVHMSANTYNALMRVYLNMEPCDWRVVYNAYYEMRQQRPKIPFGWSSYAIVAEAMRRGGATRLRRIMVWVDAWANIVPLYSAEFWIGFLVAFAGMMGLRFALVKLALWLKGGDSESDVERGAGR